MKEQTLGVGQFKIKGESKSTPHILSAWHKYVEGPLPLWTSFASLQCHTDTSMLYTMNLGHEHTLSRGKQSI